MGDFRMPSLGADMDAGTIVEWYVKPGDHVQRGDIVALVDTDKAEIEVEIFDDGVIGEILVPAGTKVPVGTVLARVGAAAEVADAAATVAAAVPIGQTPPTVRESVASSAPSIPTAPSIATVPSIPVSPRAAAAGTPRQLISPLARRRAAEIGIDLSTVTGTGPGGVVTIQDVTRAEAAGGPPSVPPISASSPAAPQFPTPQFPTRQFVVPQVPVPPVAIAEASDAADDRARSMRQAIARSMERSKREIPHYYLDHVIDMKNALDWLRLVNADRPPNERVLAAALLVKAVARACRDVEALNGFWIDGQPQLASSVHVGVAISLRSGGLLAPAIHDTDLRSVDDVMSALADLVQRVRSGRVRASEMSDPTITITNLGERGVDSLTPVIYPPQLAIVGFGRIVDEPRAVDGLIGVRPVVHASLAADHRASDGHTGARFLRSVERWLQRPAELAPAG